MDNWIEDLARAHDKAGEARRGLLAAVVPTIRIKASIEGWDSEGPADDTDRESYRAAVEAVAREWYPEADLSVEAAGGEESRVEVVASDPEEEERIEGAFSDLEEAAFSRLSHAR